MRTHIIIFALSHSLIDIVSDVLLFSSIIVHVHYRGKGGVRVYLEPVNFSRLFYYMSNTYNYRITYYYILHIIIIVFFRWFYCVFLRFFFHSSNVVNRRCIYTKIILRHITQTDVRIYTIELLSLNAYRIFYNNT